VDENLNCARSNFKRIETHSWIPQSEGQFCNRSEITQSVVFSSLTASIPSYIQCPKLHMCVWGCVFWLVTWQTASHLIKFKAGDTFYILCTRNSQPVHHR